MSDPTTTARVSPTGIRLGDGFSSKVAFSADPDIDLWEVEVTPPGIDGGEPVDITTMHNTVWTTTEPQGLAQSTPCSFVAAYDPIAYDQIVAIVNVRGSVTVHFSDGSTLDFYGYLQKFEPQNMTRGNMPLATVTVVATNYDPSTHTEVGPVMTSVAGT